MSEKPRSQPNGHRRGYGPWLACLLLPMLALAVLSPGLSGGFAFDDFPNILLNPRLAIESLKPGPLLEAAFSVPAGPLYRPVAMVSFALNHLVGGYSPFGYKLVNVLLHGAVGAALSLFVYLLLHPAGRLGQAVTEAQRPWLALLAGTLFVVHPFNLSPALYVVQRMTSLSALFSLLALAAWLAGRQRDLASGQAMRALPFAGLALFAFVVAALSKESVACLALLLPLTEWATFGTRSSARPMRVAVLGVLALGVVAFALLYAVSVGLTPEARLAHYAHRDFTLAERVFTEWRVLLFYLGETLLPRLSAMRLYHDDLVLSTGLLSPPATALALAVLLALVGVALACARRLPVVTFAIGWYLAAHVLESTAVSLELVHEHRNYLPSAGLLLLPAWALVRAGGEARRRERRVATAVLVATLALLTFSRAQTWSDPVTHAFVEARHSPNSPRSAFGLAYAAYGMYQLTDEDRFLETTREALARAAALDPEEAGAVFEQIRVTFLLNEAPDPALLDELEHRLRAFPIHPSEADRFSQLLACLRSGACNLPPERVLGIYGAALDNPTLTGASRERVLTTLADYYLNALGDPEAGERIMRALTEEAPESLSVWLNFARVLLYNDKRTEAAEALARVQAGLAQARWRYTSTVTEAEVADLSDRIKAAQERARDPLEEGPSP